MCAVFSGPASYEDNECTHKVQEAVYLVLPRLDPFMIPLTEKLCALVPCFVLFMAVVLVEPLNTDSFLVSLRRV